MTAELVRSVTVCAAFHWEAPRAQRVGLPELYLLLVLGLDTTEVGETGLDLLRLALLSLLNLFQKKIENSLKGKCN